MRRRTPLPVLGTEVSFGLPRKSQFYMWRSATVRHTANTKLVVAHHPRDAVELRVVWHGTQDRPSLRSEELYWIDRATGIPLKQDVVTTLGDGTRRHDTISELTALDAVPVL
jgi:hypothetical protein